MEGTVWRPAHLTSEQMEERRLAAAALLRQGRLSQADIARQLGVSRASISRWAATLGRHAGPAGSARIGRSSQDRATAPDRSPRLGPSGSAPGPGRSGGGLCH